MVAGKFKRSICLNIVEGNIEKIEVEQCNSCVCAPKKVGFPKRDQLYRTDGVGISIQLERKEKKRSTNGINLMTVET